MHTHGDNVSVCCLEVSPPVVPFVRRASTVLAITYCPAIACCRLEHIQQCRATTSIAASDVNSLHGGSEYGEIVAIRSERSGVASERTASYQHQNRYNGNQDKQRQQDSLEQAVLASSVLHSAQSGTNDGLARHGSLRVSDNAINAMIC